PFWGGGGQERSKRPGWVVPSGGDGGGGGHRRGKVWGLLKGTKKKQPWGCVGFLVCVKDPRAPKGGGGGGGCLNHHHHRHHSPHSVFYAILTLSFYAHCCHSHNYKISSFSAVTLYRCDCLFRHSLLPQSPLTPILNETLYCLRIT